MGAWPSKSHTIRNSLIFTDYFTSGKIVVIKNERVIGLDVIRAMAIIMVVMAHSYCLLQRLTNAPVLSRFVNLFERYIINLGPIGVELFFVLSGFLIGGILIKVFHNSGFTFKEVRVFWVRRWFRTLPNYWLILSVNILLFVFLKGNPFDASQLWGYVFLQNFVHSDSSRVFPEGWSLSVEEWFYLTLPVVIYLSAIVFKPANKGTFLWKVFISYLSFFLLVRVANAFNPINGADPDEGIRKVVVFRLDAVMYGVIAAYFNFYKEATLRDIKRYLFFISLLCSFILYYFIVRYELAFRSQHDPLFRFMSNAFLYLLIPFLFSLSLPFAAGIKAFRSRFINVVVQHISKISYSVYLVHFSLFIPMFYNLKVTATWMGIAQYFLYWIVVLVCSSLLYRYFEYPVTQLRDKWK